MRPNFHTHSTKVNTTSQHEVVSDDASLLGIRIVASMRATMHMQKNHDMRERRLNVHFGSDFPANRKFEEYKFVQVTKEVDGSWVWKFQWGFVEGKG